MVQPNEALVALKNHALVIDDHDGLRKALAAELRETHDVIVCSNVADALACLGSGKVIDAIVTDLQLEDGDGLTILETARRVLPNCRRVLVSGATLDGRIDRALGRGLAHRFVSKPWLTGQVRQAVEGIDL